MIETRDPPVERRGSGLRRLRGVRHLAVAAIAVIIVATALPIPPIEAVGERLQTVARVTHLTQSWQVFAPNVRSGARWTEVVTHAVDGTIQRRNVEDDRNMVAGFRGIRYRKLGEHVRRSCRVARNYAEVVLDDPDVVRVELYRVEERRADGAAAGEWERERMMLVWEDEQGAVEVDRTGCGR